MNIELAREVIEDAKLYRDRFSMSAWMAEYAGEDEWGPRYLDTTVIKEEDQTIPPCGTVGCFAGFTALRLVKPGAIISNGEILHTNGHKSDVSQYAAKALGLSEDQAQVIFYLNNLEEVEVAVNFLAEHPRADDLDLQDVIDAARPNA